MSWVCSCTKLGVERRDKSVHNIEKRAGRGAGRTRKVRGCSVDGHRERVRRARDVWLERVSVVDDRAVAVVSILVSRCARNGDATRERLRCRHIRAVIRDRRPRRRIIDGFERATRQSDEASGE